MKLIYSLNEPTHTIKKEFIGEKAFNLIFMKNKNINVPAGFVLSVDAWDKKEEINLKDVIQSSLNKISSTFVMVRSSAVGEDGAQFSFAGQLDSFQVENNSDKITAAIYQCWKSLTNERIKTYANFNGKVLLKMGVIVQEMIEPEYAGVMFTAAPNDLSSPLIEYVKGHCEKLVSGKETPKSVSLPYTGNNKPVFLDQLDSEAQKILKIYNEHQDIEWAYKNKEVFIVQSRPITTIKEQFFWSSTNINENYPNKLSPLLYSIARRSYYFYFKNLFQKFYIFSGKENCYYNIVGLWGDRVYYNMTNIYSLIALTPFKSLLKQSFNNFVGYQKDSCLEEKSSNFLDKVLFVLRLFRHGFYLPKYVNKIEKRVSQFTNKDIDNNINFLFHEFLDIRFNFWVNASFSDFYAMLSHGLLGKYLKTLKIKNALGLHNSLLQSIPNLVSNKPILEIWKIKKFILKKNFQDLFLLQNSKEIYSQITHNKKYFELNQIIQSYLKNWGFRCSGELLFLNQNFIENPYSFIDIIKSYLNADDCDPKEQFSIKEKQQKQELKKVTSKISIIHSLILRFLVSFARFSISCRERVRLKQAHAYSHFKAVNLALGKELVTKKMLDVPSDIFYLEYDEISRILNKEFFDTNYLQNLIGIRKNKIEKSSEYPENFHSTNVNFQNDYVDQDTSVNLSKNMYLGLSACGGKVKARAVVLKSIHEIGKLKKGDILITKQTDPGWICAFPIISGLVVERGGMLSHGAIVAREFGIPAVVGIKDITEIINTDTIITVDGNKGIVECHPS